jgi:hypothetical protein
MTGMAYAGDKWSLTIPYKGEGKEERIESLKLNVQGAWVYAFPKFPRGWTIEILDLGYKTEIKGYAGHGVAMEYPEFFRDFIVFEKTDDPKGLESEFDVDLELTVFLDPETSKMKDVAFKKKDLLLRKVIAVDVR